MSFPAKILVHDYELPRFRDDRLLALVAADGRPGDLDADLVGDLHLHGLVVRPA